MKIQDLEKIRAVIYKQNFNRRTLQVSIHNNLKIRTPLYYQAQFIVLFFTISLLFCSCAAPTAYQKKDDIQALQNIYEESNWTFQQSSVDVQVNEGGAVKLSIDGEAIEKVSGENSSIWIPVAMLKELPEYFGIDGDNSTQAKLMAYKVKGGLWSIVALVPDKKAQGIVSSKKPSIDKNVLMPKSSMEVSKKTSKNVLMPTSSIEVSKKAQEIVSFMPKSSIDKNVLMLSSMEVSKKAQGIVSFMPTSSMKVSKKTSESDVSSGNNLGTQKQPRTRRVSLDVLMISPVFAQSLPLNLPFGQGLASVKTSVELPKEAKFTSLWAKRDGESVKLTEVPASISKGKVKALARLQPELATIWDFSNVEYRLPGDWFSRQGLQKSALWFSLLCVVVIAVWIGREISLRLRYREQQSQYREQQSQYREQQSQYREIQSQYREEQSQYLEEQSQYLEIQLQFRLQEVRLLFYRAAAFLAVIAFTLLIASVALSKEPNRKQNKSKSSNQSMLLGEFNFNVNSSDYNSDKVKATLSFLPLSSKPKTNNQGQITIEFGDKKVKLLEQNKESSEIDVVPVDLSSRLKYQVRNIPIKVVPDLGPLTAASKGGIQIDQYSGIADIYNQALKTEPKPVFIEMEYEIDNVLVHKDQIPNMYFNWFPADKSQLEMQITVEGAATIVSQIEVETPKDLFTQVKQSGIGQMEADLKRDEKQLNKYKLARESNKFIVINLGSKVMLTGDYERNLPGKAFYTYGIVIIGGIIGLVVGLMPSDWKSLYKSIGASIAVALASVLAILALNKDVQSLITSRSQFSFFDVFLILSLFSLVVNAVSIYSLKNTRDRTNKLILIKTLGVFGVLSIGIPFVVTTFFHP